MTRSVDLQSPMYPRAKSATAVARAMLSRSEENAEAPVLWTQTSGETNPDRIWVNSDAVWLAARTYEAATLNARKIGQKKFLREAHAARNKVPFA